MTWSESLVSAHQHGRRHAQRDAEDTDAADDQIVSAEQEECGEAQVQALKSHEISDPNEKGESHVIDGSQITLTHEELQDLLNTEKQRFQKKELKLRQELQQQQDKNLRRWLDCLAKKKKKKREREDLIQMLKDQNEKLQKRNNELRDRTLELEKQLKEWLAWDVHGFLSPLSDLSRASLSLASLFPPSLPLVSPPFFCLAY